ncbi:MAG: ABC transporter substrate-binding protein [Propionibacteriaceae bacterium]|jgi:NitT/TauT family transport system substrate-binding protein|nr:ABC transporter substrate-binding protein [Propionibacteriaceae bacterium]
MKTALIRRLGLVLAATLCLSLVGCTEPVDQPTPEVPQATSTTVGLTFIPNIQFAPFYIAEKNGFTGDYEHIDNVEVTLRHHGAGEGLFTALAAGDEDFVVAGGDEILEARTQGIDLVAVASYYGQYPVRFIVPEGSDIASVADLRGHSIGLPGRFGENWYALLIALNEAGLTEEDVEIVEIGYTHQVALTTGQVDAVVGFANSDVINFQTAGFPVTVIDPEVPLVSICLATTRAYAEANPKIVGHVIAGMKAGMRAAIDDTEGTLTIAADYIPSFRGETVDAARVVLPATAALFVDDAGKVSPELNPGQWTRMAEAMTAVGLIPEGTDASLAFSNDYLLS